MNFDANTPIYLQIMDDFKIQLMKGTWKGGDKVASVRELAVQYGVNTVNEQVGVLLPKMRNV